MHTRLAGGWLHTLSMHCHIGRSAVSIVCGEPPSSHDRATKLRSMSVPPAPQENIPY